MSSNRAVLHRAARFVMAVAAGLTAIIVLPAPAQAATAAFAQESQWSSGYIGKITIHNDGAATMSSWRVEFNLPADTTVGSHWNAHMTRDGSRFVFSNMHYNGTVASGASVSFGFLANGTGQPQGCLVNGAPCAGLPRVDVTPPTTPGNARYIAGAMTTLTWDPSVDDTGVVEYQIFHRTTQIATTTSTSYSMPTPPPMVTTFGVRAVDAAGNLSPFAPIHFGQLPDSTPPTAPVNLRISGISQNGINVRWEAATDETFLVGYEVYLNGVLINRVGGTTAVVPYSGYGTYIVRVRAWDSSGNFGPIAQTGIAVDPPPPPPSSNSFARMSAK